MNAPIRIGIIGAGRMGLDHAVRVRDRISGAVLTAIVEPDGVRRSIAATEFSDARMFVELDDAVGHADLDAVIIASPGRFHEEALLKCLDSKLDVLCEKPLTPDTASAIRVLEAEQRADRPLIQVGFMRRFDPEYAGLKQLVDSHELGELLMLHCVHRNPEMPEFFTQEMLIDDSVVHEFDLVSWFSGSEIAGVEVRYPRRSSNAPPALAEPLFVLCELENGVLADVEMSANARFGYQVTMEAVFENGIARVGQPSGLQRWHEGSFRIEESQDFLSRFRAAYDIEIQSWVNAVEEARLGGPNAYDGYRVAAACEAGVEALTRSGQTIAVEQRPRPSFYA